MAKKNQSTLVASTEWWKHLRPFLKRKQAKRERLAAKTLIKKDLQ